MRLFRNIGTFNKRESGVSLIETVVALFVLGTIAIIFLSGLVISSRAVFTADEQATAESLARSQMEWAKNTAYSYDCTGYSPAAIPSGKDYIGYSVTIAAEPLHTPDEGIQKIAVTVQHSNESVIVLEGYKVNR